jgi:site-specific DNA-methyltransferase (adenine-specific)
VRRITDGHGRGEINTSKASDGGVRENRPTANHHPTVKPIELATYLARMLLPPPGPEPRRILVPFSGSGSEMIGAVLAGWDEVVGVEMSQEYIAIATARLKHWAKRTAPKKKTTKPQLRKRAMPVQMEMFG